MPPCGPPRSRCANASPVESASYAVAVARAVGMNVPEVLLALEHEDRGRGDVPMDRAVAAVVAPAHEHVERARIDVVTEHGVVVIHEVGERRVSRDAAPAMTRRIERTLHHHDLLVSRPLRLPSARHAASVSANSVGPPM